MLVLMADHRATDARVGHALQAMLVMNDIDDRAQASGRDHLIYRLNGDVRYLDAYRWEQKGIPAALQRLRGLIAGESDQVGRLERLTTLVDQDAAELQRQPSHSGGQIWAWVPCRPRWPTA